MKRALLVLLALPAFANEPPYKPLAVCEKGKCWMAQEDYEKFQKFHVATFDAIRERDELIEMLTKENATLQQKLSRNIVCDLKRT